MTAINVIRQSGAVHVLTDGAGIDANGAVVLRTQKVFPLAHLNAVIACRGWPLFAACFAAQASIEASSFDQLKTIAVRLARSVIADAQHLMEASYAGAEFDLVIAGWSEGTGPNSYFLCSYEGVGVAPWAVAELGEISLLPTNEAVNADLEAAFPNGVRPDDVDPAAVGLRILEIQRKHPTGRGLLRNVGAFAQLTTVTPDLITTRIIHRWPDELGRPLDGG
jgi:hypothetical protein